jgi:hypothetical protein
MSLPEPAFPPPTCLPLTLKRTENTPNSSDKRSHHIPDEIMLCPSLKSKSVLPCKRLPDTTTSSGPPYLPAFFARLHINAQTTPRPNPHSPPTLPSTTNTKPLSTPANYRLVTNFKFLIVGPDQKMVLELVSGANCG